MKLVPSKTTVYRLRYEVRKRVERFDNAQVRNARRLLKALHSDPPDVLYVGDSTAAFVAPQDADRRRLSVMVGDLLGPDVSYFAINGGSYHADLIADYLQLLRPLTARPVLIVPLWVRGRYVPWVQHPVFGHRAAMAYLRSIPADRAPWRIRGGFPNPTPAEFEEFYKLRHPTFVGDLTIGEYVRPLKDAARWRGREDERVKLLHAYHHGAALVAGSPEMAAVTRLGRTIRDLGCDVVAYQTPVPVESGVRYFGEQFADLATANFAVLDDAFSAGVGWDVPIIQSGQIFGSDEFIDITGADEHLNEKGRARLAHLISDEALRLVAQRADRAQIG